MFSICFSPEGNFDWRRGWGWGGIRKRKRNEVEINIIWNITLDILYYLFCIYFVYFVYFIYLYIIYFVYIFVYFVFFVYFVYCGHPRSCSRVAVADPSFDHTTRMGALREMRREADRRLKEAAAAERDGVVAAKGGYRAGIYLRNRCSRCNIVWIYVRILNNLIIEKINNWIV